jgi:hypothetical protein
MKRKDFIHKLLISAGGVGIISCDELILDNSLSVKNLDNISLPEAKKWFLSQDFNIDKNSRLSSTKKYKRKVDFEKSKLLKGKINLEYISIPVEYEDDSKPGIIYSDKNSTYREKLPKAYVHPIIEFLIIYKEKNQYKSLLAQVAYDRFAVDPNSTILKMENFTGWLLIADWEDKLQEGVQFQKGKPFNSFNLNLSKKAKPTQCSEVTFTYQTVTGADCGPNCSEITVTLTVYSQLVCTNDTPSYNYPYNFYNYTSGGNDGYSSYYYYFDQYPIRNYNVQRAMCTGGADRSTFNSQIADAVNATSLAVDIVGFSWDKAEAIVRSTGGTFEQYFPLAGQIGKRIGMVGIALDGYQVIVGVTDGDFSWDMNGDLGNVLQLTLGVASLVAAPWVAAGFGAVSVGIAIYSATHPCN